MAKNEQITSDFVIVQPDNSLSPALPAGSVNNSNIVDVSETKVTGVTAGSIPFVGSDLKFTEDNAKLFWNDANTRLGVGTNTPAIGSAVAARAYLTIKGSTDLGSLELVSGTATDAANTILGQLVCSDANNASADKRTTLIQGITEGITANNRGGAISIRTRLDGGASVTERAYLNNRGYFGIGSNSKLSTLTTTPIADFTASGTTTANATTAITGVTSNFLVELGIGDRISLSSAPATFATVVSIGSSTSLTTNIALGNGTSQTILVKKSIFRADTAGSATNAATINDEGKLLLGAPFDVNGAAGFLQLQDTGAGCNIHSVRYTTSASTSPSYNFRRSRGTSIGSYVAVAAADFLGQINFAGIGTDAAAFTNAAQIRGDAEGTIGSAIVPGRLVLSTANSAGTLTTAMTIDSSQFVGIGGTPLYRLDVQQTSAPISAIRYANNSGTETADLRFLSTNASFLNNWAGIRVQQEGGVDTHNIQFFTAPTAAATERLRITAAGKLLFGGFATPRGSIGADSVSANYQQEGSNTNASGAMLVVGNNSNNLGAIVQFGKSRGTTPNTSTIVQSGDIIARMEFLGADGTTLIPAASIKAEVDGTPGTNDMPGRIVFSTTPDGGASVAERWRIDNVGRIAMGGSTDTASIISIDNAQNQTTLSTTSQYGLSSFIRGTSAATSVIGGISSAPATAAASFTCANVDSFLARTISAGAGSTITRATQFRGARPTAGTNNAVFSDDANYTGNYFLYNGSSDQTRFTGNMGVGGDTLGNAKLEVLKSGTYSIENSASLYMHTGSSGQPALEMGVDNANTVAWIQSLARGTSFQTVPLSLNPNGGAVAVGTISPASGMHLTVKTSQPNASTFFRIEGTSGDNSAVIQLMGSTTVNTSNWRITQNATISGAFEIAKVNGGTLAAPTFAAPFLYISTGGGVNIQPTANNGITVTAATNTSTQSNLFAFNGSSVAGVFNGDLSGGMSTGSNGAASMMRLAMATSTSRSINAAGTINASGADYAEYMYKDVSEEIIAPAEVCGVKANGKLTKKWSEAIRFVVKSTSPAYVGGDVWAPEELENESREDYNVRHEIERVKVDRIAFCGQVPCSVTGDFEAGDWIIAQEGDDDAIEAIAVADGDLTWAQHKKALGQVWKEIDEDTALIAVKL